MSVKALNIIFMGTPNFAVPILKSVNESKHKILEVYTQPPTKKNRGLKIQNSSIHNFADKLNIPVRHPISFKDNNEIEHIKKLNPDIVIVVAYGKILPETLLKIDNVLFINIHVYSLEQGSSRHSHFCCSALRSPPLGAKLAGPNTGKLATRAAHTLH